MFIETIPNRGSPPAVLLRESFREGKRVRKRTLANLSQLPTSVIDGLRGLLKGGIVVAADGGGEGLQVTRSLPHGHVAAALGTLRKIALDRLLLSTTTDAATVRHCDLIVAMIVDRLVTPRSKLGFVRAVSPVRARRCGRASVAPSLASASMAVTRTLGSRSANAAMSALTAGRPPISPSAHATLYEIETSAISGMSVGTARSSCRRPSK